MFVHTVGAERPEHVTPSKQFVVSHCFDWDMILGTAATQFWLDCNLEAVSAIAVLCLSSIARREEESSTTNR